MGLSRMVRFAPCVACAIGLVLVLPLERALPAQTLSTGQPPPPIVLSEVLANPRPGEVPFVELLNAGQAPVDLSLWCLRVGDQNLLLSKMTDTLPAGARLLVLIDGQGGLEGRTMHAPSAITIDARSGAIELRDGLDRVVDRMAWGSEPGAIAINSNVGTGLGPEPGAAFGRPPGVTGHSDLDWVVYPPGSSTPGAPNPVPAAEDLVPIDGALLTGTSADLGWEPLAGAARYHVQVASEDTFASVLVDDTVTEAGFRTGTLRAGRYAWHVQAIAADGARSAFSAVSHFELMQAGVASASTVTDPLARVAFRRATPGSWTPSAVTPLADAINVPYLTQHKDSPMLLLESQTYKGPHPWDADHGVPNRLDLADSQNCAAANIAMITRYFGGDLSQDRIGYEVLSRNVKKYEPALRRLYLANLTLALNSQQQAEAALTEATQERAPGPERDLIYGSGLRGLRITAALIFALGVEPDYFGSFPTRDDMWAHIVEEIRAGRPILAGNSHHTFTIRAFREDAGRRFVAVNDPANGRYEIDLASAQLAPANTSFWLIPAGARGRLEEPTVTSDADGDGVVDFDETERFMTDPNNVDSDGDGVHDKEDIASGVFEKEFGLGYAYNAATGSREGRDYDHDGLPTERDPDSDNGGCKDGQEDLNGDGFRTGQERSNFSELDDVCGELEGRLVASVSVTRKDVNGATMIANDTHRLVALIKLKQDTAAGPQHFADDGSSFVYTVVHHLTISQPGCDLVTRQTAHGTGGFQRDGFSATGHVSEDGLIVDFHGELPDEVTVDSCIGGETRHETMGFGTETCLGRPVRDPSISGRSFSFNCDAPLSPDPAITIHEWRVTGFVRLR